MELKKNMLQCYQQVLDLTLTQEETQEAIVPDAFPDILRIVSVTGQLCISEKKVSDEEILVTGMIETFVLYLPEEGDDLEKVSVRLPFTCECSAAPLKNRDEVFVIPSLLRGEARILNPRKILVKMDYMLEIAGYQGNTLMLSCGVEDANGVEERIIETEVQPLTSVDTKHFTFDETITLQGQGNIEELLWIRIYPNCNESRVIGNKLIFKGDTEVQVMYLSTEGQVEQSRHQLPFSQILEMDEMGEEGTSAVSMVLQSYYINPTYTGGKTLELTLDLMAQASIRGIKHLTLLQDAYSITHQLEVEQENYTLVTMAEEFVVPQPIRQIFETTMPVQSVQDSWVSMGKVSQSREGDQLTFSCDMTIFLLCCDESGAWNTLEFNHTIRHKTECPTYIMSCCRCTPVSEVFATPAPGGMEVRLSPQFSYTLVETSPVTAVGSGTLGEGREKGNTSVVLRLPQEGESLWDIAKNYGTTITEIMQANEFQEEYPPSGKMLLIPSVR